MTGFLSKKNEPIPNKDILKAIDEDVESLNERGVRVQFWHVNRNRNAMADLLAKARFNGVNARKAMER
jgi:ribonuclease HI